MTSVASADSQRVIDYVYDEAGNLVRIESVVSENPPAIQSITPGVMRVGPPVGVMAPSTDLRLLRVDRPRFCGEHRQRGIDADIGNEASVSAES